MDLDIDEVLYVTGSALTIGGTQRRITAPKSIVDRIGLRNGERIRLCPYRDGKVMVLKAGGGA